MSTPTAGGDDLPGPSRPPPSRSGRACSSCVGTDSHLRWVTASSASSAARSVRRTRLASEGTVSTRPEGRGSAMWPTRASSKPSGPPWLEPRSTHFSRPVAASSEPPRREFLCIPNEPPPWISCTARTTQGPRLLPNRPRDREETAWLLAGTWIASGNCLNIRESDAGVICGLREPRAEHVDQARERQVEWSPTDIEVPAAIRNGCLRSPQEPPLG